MGKPGGLRLAWSAVQDGVSSTIAAIVSTEAGPEDGADQWKSQGLFMSK